MCVVADPPTLIPMFKQSDPEHMEFVHVRDWIVTGPGKFVVGGSKYKIELLAVGSILPFLAELERRGKIVRYRDVDIDAEEVAVKLIEPSGDFDDHHLVALIRFSGCKLICIRDMRSHRFLRSTLLYSTSTARPNLYTRAKNKTLLNQNYIAHCCD